METLPIKNVAVAIDLDLYAKLQEKQAQLQPHSKFKVTIREVVIAALREYVEKEITNATS